MTKALYYTDMERNTCNSTVVKTAVIDGKTHLILDQTVFYPQGGGQPSDTGLIQWDGGTLKVEKVLWNSDEIIHIGELNGKPPLGSVHCKIEIERRKRNMKLHSAGHLIDMALVQMGGSLKPIKGFHYPEGPYLEYEGEMPNKDIFITKLNEALQILIDNDLKTSIKLNTDKPGKSERFVSFGDYTCPCGGTHVSKTGELKGLKIRKIKVKKNRIKISYHFET